MAESNLVLHITSTYNEKGNSERDKIQRQLTFACAKMLTCNEARATNLNSNTLRAPQYPCD